MPAPEDSASRWMGGWSRQAKQETRTDPDGAYLGLTFCLMLPACVSSPFILCSTVGLRRSYKTHQSSVQGV